VRFGVTYGNSGPGAHPEHAVALARLTEEAGFDSLWAVEHAVIPAGFESRYPYSRDGRLPGGEDVPIADPLVWLAFVAAATARVRLATGILILPQRNPVLLAKETASLDVLSGGRLVLGVGVGWLREEFDALGVPWPERGARTEEYVAALRLLWNEPAPSFDGRFVAFDKAKSYPKPVQPGGVPVVVGGHSDAAARRAGRIGDGFFPAVADPDEVARLVGIARASASEAGRDPDDLEITCGTPRDPDGIARLADLGVARLTTSGVGDLDGVRAKFARFRERVMDRVG
jgi:probable F420-dependent oxidoreductase